MLSMKVHVRVRVRIKPARTNDTAMTGGVVRIEGDYQQTDRRSLDKRRAQGQMYAFKGARLEGNCAGSMIYVFNQCYPLAWSTPGNWMAVPPKERIIR